MGQRVSVGMPDQLFGGIRISHKISFLRRAAPCSSRIPVPGLDKQLRILTVRDRPPADLKDLLYLIWTEEGVRHAGWNAIDSCAKSTGGAKRVCNVTGSTVD